MNTMNTTTTTTTHETDESIVIRGNVAAALAARDADALRVTWTEANGLGRIADTKSVDFRLNEWRTRGDILAAAAIMHAEAEADGASVTVDLHKLGQAKLEAAAKAILGVDVKASIAKKCVRASLYVTAERLADAKDTLGTPEGPKSPEGYDVLVWCQAHDATGRKLLGKFSGTPVPDSAKAVAAVSAKSAAKSADRAKAERDTAKAKATKLGQAILAANDDTVYGGLRASAWAAMTAEQLSALVDTANAVKLGTAANAAAAKVKTSTSTKSAKSVTIGSKAFNDAVAAAVAAQMAAAK